MRGRIYLRGVLAGAAAVFALGVGASGAGATGLSGSPIFGQVAVGTSKTQQFTVSNGCVTPFMGGCGFAETSQVAPSVTGVGFALAANGCPPTLTVAGQTCQLSVTFTPASAGVLSGTLYANSSGVQASLTGIGVAPTTPKKKGKRKCKAKKGASAAGKKGCKKK